MNKQLVLKKRIQEVFAENAIYLNYIGIFKENKEELFSVHDAQYDSTFDLNFIHAFTSISLIRNKSSDSTDFCGKLKSFFANYKSLSYYVEQVGKQYVLVVFKKGFENLGFLVHLTSLLREEINKINN